MFATRSGQVRSIASPTVKTTSEPDMPRGSPPRRRELRSRPQAEKKSPSPRKTRQTKPSTEGLDQEKILELWAQFTADHYEMVEQLPLELHRNSRLLKEMDQESVGESSSSAVGR